MSPLLRSIFRQANRNRVWKGTKIVAESNPLVTCRASSLLSFTFFFFNGGNTQTNLEIDKVLRPSARAVVWAR